MDLSKLPLLFGVVPTSNTGSRCSLQDGHGRVHLEGEWNGGNVAAIEFAVLARQAFDVMLRRGWYVIRQQGEDDRLRWAVFQTIDDEGVRVVSGEDYFPHFAADPFTALVEADEWLKAREGKADA